MGHHLPGGKRHGSSGSCYYKSPERHRAEVGDSGLYILKEIGIFLEVPVTRCIDCKQCMEECPENALEIIKIDDKKIAKHDSQKCLGTSCRRCVSICPENAIDITKLKIKSK